MYTLEESSITNIIKLQKPRWAGHVVRMENSRYLNLQKKIVGRNKYREIYTQVAERNKGKHPAHETG